MLEPKQNGQKGRLTSIDVYMHKLSASSATTRCLLTLSLLLFANAVLSSDDSAMQKIPGGSFSTVLPPAEGVKSVTVKAFKLDRTPVTNADFVRFVGQHPEWRRDRVARLFADAGYLKQWPSATQSAAVIRDAPVVQVSWFAASAYCEARGARLPTWYEWEYTAAANETQRDARDDPEWRQRILSWYSTSGRSALPNVGHGAANVYGIHDLHGVVWEWIDDLSSMMVSGDNRQQSDPETTRFCGTGALSMEQKENYAILMRIAMLSSMQAKFTSSTMGFRCATDISVFGGAGSH
jgi:formylglycine-generating enzyme required for sulfatase activity